MSWFFCMVRKVSCLQIINPLEIENLWCCGRILLWFSRCMTMTDLCVSRRNPILLVQWDGRNFPLWSIFCVPSLWWRTASFKCQRQEGKSLSQTVEPGCLSCLWHPDFCIRPLYPELKGEGIGLFCHWWMLSVWGARGDSKAVRYNFLELASYMKLGRSLLFLYRWALCSSRCQAVCQCHVVLRCYCLKHDKSCGFTVRIYKDSTSWSGCCVCYFVCGALSVEVFLTVPMDSNSLCRGAECPLSACRDIPSDTSSLAAGGLEEGDR